MKTVKVAVGGRTLPMALTLGALEEICDLYGSLGAMQEKLQSGSAEQIRTVRQVCEILMKAGAELEGSPCEAGWLKKHARPGDLAALSEAMSEAIRIGMATETDDEEAERDGVLEDIQKNAVSGAGN